ncbi:hypothetical protein J8273_3784 [Carpediemonas membranifera]|uniref:Uncharacterized protein n=1 Tax=Carpediemonas membranifera TaxID=201153 RepID=A0A8J6B5P3_9EUKA|nr:hypothetical protein J8273_3784 [Carpediemonas membranifera]|eukprot:KAG9394804.1 hypothetical protein J8273_3784 [Carpediemonas membranifera]
MFHFAPILVQMVTEHLGELARLLQLVASEESDDPRMRSLQRRCATLGSDIQNLRSSRVAPGDRRRKRLVRRPVCHSEPASSVDESSNDDSEEDESPTSSDDAPGNDSSPTLPDGQPEANQPADVTTTVRQLSHASGTDVSDLNRLVHRLLGEHAHSIALTLTPLINSLREQRFEREFSLEDVERQLKGVSCARRVLLDLQAFMKLAQALPELDLHRAATWHHEMDAIRRKLPGRGDKSLCHLLALAVFPGVYGLLQEACYRSSDIPEMEKRFRLVMRVFKAHPQWVPVLMTTGDGGLQFTDELRTYRLERVVGSRNGPGGRLLTLKWEDYRFVTRSYPTPELLELPDVVAHLTRHGVEPRSTGPAFAGRGRRL